MTERKRPQKIEASQVALAKSLREKGVGDAIRMEPGPPPPGWTPVEHADEDDEA